MTKGIAVSSSWTDFSHSTPDSAVMSDEELCMAVAQGDEKAFAVLVDRYLPRLLAVSTRMLANPSEADDVAQEAMLRVWTRSILWQPGSAKFGTWLHRVVINLCIDRLRKRTFRPLEDAAEVVDLTANPQGDSERLQIGRAVREALDQLPGKQKAAVVLCHYEGYTGKEAAAILQISVLAVQSLLVRARAALRLSLAAYAAEGQADHA